jgi:hypothetical protein
MPTLKLPNAQATRSASPSVDHPSSSDILEAPPEPDRKPNSAMSLELYQEVALTRDIPEHRLRKGDLATLIEVVPHPLSGEPGCILEIFNAIGESIAVITVPEPAITALCANTILNARPLPQAS